MNSNPFRLVIIVGSLFVLLFRVSGQDGQVVHSSIESVKVYPGAASVTRSAHVELNAGENLLVFRFLPSRLDPNSLKPILSAASGVVIRDLSIQSNDVARDEYPILVQLVDELKTLQETTNALVETIDLQKEKIQFAEQISKSFTAGYGQKEGTTPSAETVESTWNFYEKTIREANVILHSVQKELKPLEEIIVKKEREIAEVESKVGNLGLTVAVLLEAENASAVDFHLEYLIRGCSWQPVYEVRAFPLRDLVHMRYLASISQNTGEDWTQVQLSLSTSQASSYGDVPRLYPIRLNKIERQAAMMKAMSRNEMEESVSYQPLALSMAAPAPVFESSFSSFSVMLPEEFTIESGGDWKKALISEKELDSEFWTEVVPTQEEAGYLVSEVENSFEFPLLAGEVVLFVEQNMVGKSHLSETAIGANIELSLGINENVIVERNRGKLNEKDRGIFGKTRRMTRQYFTTIENKGKHDLAIRLKDQFPVSENEKIVVKSIFPTEEQVTFEKNTGVFTQKIVLKTNEKQEFETKFVVEYPESWDIPTHF